MAYGDRAHFDRWAADKHGRAKTPEFYVRSHEADLPGPDAEKKAAELRAKWGLEKNARGKPSPPEKRGPAGKRRAPSTVSSSGPRTGPSAASSPVEKALAAYAEALKRKAAADAVVRERQAALNASIVERDACDHDVRETWGALEAINAQITSSGAAVALGPPDAAPGDAADPKRRRGG